MLTQQSSSISGLLKAAPYIRLFQGTTFVVKVGGEAFLDEAGAERVLSQIALLQLVGIRMVLVHGGGAQADQLAEKLGVETEKIAGRRITSAKMVETMQMALHGQVQGLILSVCRKLGLPAVSLSGMDAGLIEATVRPPLLVEGNEVNFGQVGEIDSIDPTILESLLDQGILPVVSPLCGTAEGEWLNINADTVAAKLAIAMGAEKVVFLIGPHGILADQTDDHSLLSHLSLSDLEKLEKDGAIGGGMLPKSASIADCLKGGVHRVHLVTYLEEHALLTEIFTNEGSGTLVELEVTG